MPGGLARIIVYILLIVPLLVISLLVTRQVQFAFDLRKEAISVKGPANAALDLQQVMANSELSTRSFFLIFICFLMILFGLLIIFRGTEYAFSHSKEPRVKYSLRIAYPGLIMAIIGCLVLAYSVYKTSEVQRASTRQLLGVQPESGQPMKAADLIIYQPGTDTGSVTAIEETVVAKAAPGPVQQEEPVVAPATEKNAT